MKTVLIGVTGGIAAYKSAEIVNDLTKKGYDVHVVMTEHALEFITPLTFQTLSANPVVTGMFDKVDKWDTEHITLAKKADVILVAPATANIIGKLSAGIADDMLTTIVMASKAPKIISPAMNSAMLENPIVQRNLSTLEAFGFRILPTGEGRLACGDIGNGKLLAWQEIVEAVEETLA